MSTIEERPASASPRSSGHRIPCSVGGGKGVRNLFTLGRDGVGREQVNGGMARREVVPFRCEECGGEFTEWRDDT